jgi:hypothetical protein
LDDLIELMGYIWPDEHYLKNEFHNDDSVINNSMKDPHTEIKMGIAETILELLMVCCWENVAIQEYMFFEIIPNVQKFVRNFIYSLLYSLEWDSERTRISSCSSTWSKTQINSLNIKRSLSITSYSSSLRNYL